MNNFKINKQNYNFQIKIYKKLRLFFDKEINENQHLNAN